MTFYDSINIVTTQNNTKDDEIGKPTIAVLKEVRKVAYLLNSNHPSSLGLHPAVYFYSQEGRHKSASFLAITDFVVRLYKQRKLNDFIKVRSKFESFILEYEYLSQQINRKYRTSQKSHPHISVFLELVADGLKNGKSNEDILKEIQSNNKFSYLSIQKPKPKTGAKGKKFDTKAKSAVYLREVLKTAPKCNICGGYIHKNSISIDHIIRRRDGGRSSTENAQLTHPYCNTGYKS